MASRWTTSGIDWTDIKKNRTEHVIDELYLAFKEREAIYDYLIYKSGSSVASWDTNHSLRDVEKLSLIMDSLQTWLRSDYGSFDIHASHKSLCWFDHTVTQSTNTVDYTKPYNGMTWLNSDASGNLETETGVSLARIRDWGNGSTYRVDTDLLDMIYKVLKALKEVYLVNWNHSITVFPNTSMPTYNPNLITKNAYYIDESDSSFSQANTDYLAATEAESSFYSANLINVGQIETSLFSGTYRILHVLDRFIHNTGTGLKNSKNTSKNMSDFNVKGNGVSKDYGTETFGATFTLDTISADVLQASDELRASPAYDYHFNSMPTPSSGKTQLVYELMMPRGKIDSTGIIEYYTP